MRILHINTYDQGGSAKACFYLHEGLLKEGVESNILYKQRTREREGTFQFRSPVRLPSFRDRLSTKARRILSEFHLVKRSIEAKEPINSEFFRSIPENIEFFSFPSTGLDIMQVPEYWEADVVHLHWVAEFLDYSAFFKFNSKPLVWTLHDMAPFSGGLHYAETFAGMDKNGMPKVRTFSSSEEKLFDRNIMQKKVALDGVNKLWIVTPSRWLGNQSERSAVLSKFPHFLIANGFDTQVFRMRNKEFARDFLELPKDKTICLFVADTVSNTRKGLSFLVTALQEINAMDLLLCTVGAGEIELPNGLNHRLGPISDDRIMSLAYAAADVFIIPSLEDNLPNTMIEALLCGTPVIGFPVGGIAETIKDEVNGFLCSEISIDAMKKAIERMLTKSVCFNRSQISKDAQQKYDNGSQSRKYMELYSSILDG